MFRRKFAFGFNRNCSRKHCLGIVIKFMGVAELYNNELWIRNLMMTVYTKTYAYWMDLENVRSLSLAIVACIKILYESSILWFVYVKFTIPYIIKYLSIVIAFMSPVQGVVWVFLCFSFSVAISASRFCFRGLSQNNSILHFARLLFAELKLFQSLTTVLY